MVPKIEKLGTGITPEECDRYKDKIRANYKIDPFNYEYEKGSATASICGGILGLNYLANRSGKTKFGLDYNTVLQYRNPIEAQSTTSFYLSKSFEIVEVSRVTTRDNKIFAYDTSAIDRDGNVYRHHYISRSGMKSGGVNMRGRWDMSFYVAANGSIPFQLIRFRLQDHNDPSQYYAQLIFKPFR